MILAIDNEGNQYITLTQDNTNDVIIKIFMKELVKMLDKKRESWRKDTVIFLDGASYHQSDATMKLMKRLKIPYMILGPHSYNAAPCELYFAKFKSADINPRKVPAGKR